MQINSLPSTQTLLEKTNQWLTRMNRSLFKQVCQDFLTRVYRNGTASMFLFASDPTSNEDNCLPRCREFFQEGFDRREGCFFKTILDYRRVL